MLKNSQIHLWLESDLKKLVEEQAKEEGITFSELCRRKLRGNQSITRIEIMIKRILEVLDRKIYKEVQLKENIS